MPDELHLVFTMFFFSFQIWLILHLQIMVVSFRFFLFIHQYVNVYSMYSVYWFLRYHPKIYNWCIRSIHIPKILIFFYTCILQWWLVIKQRKLIEIFFMNLFFLQVHLQYKQCSSLSKYILHSNSMIMCSLIFMK